MEDKKRSIQVEFELKSFKQQIEREILRLLESWNKDLDEDEKNDPEKKAYGLLFKVELYNKIREIYSCEIPFPQDTPELFGLKVGILKENNWRPLYIVNKEAHKKYAH